ncbi:hypothetical protein L2E82_47450 [Cichorium intybus]|uniref:Uncharacterized protein n=1 Tax=Cichorium intybus TaxID=13427 RepID=A0ACB8YW95_CICIN|nr:hypothetical protein L2E82_47450 [Cichorium intybus]
MPGMKQPGPDSIGIVAISHGCAGVAARAYGLLHRCTSSTFRFIFVRLQASSFCIRAILFRSNLSVVNYHRVLYTLQASSFSFKHRYLTSNVHTTSSCRFRVHVIRKINRSFL